MGVPKPRGVGCRRSVPFILNPQPIRVFIASNGFGAEPCFASDDVVKVSSPARSEKWKFGKTFEHAIPGRDETRKELNSHSAEKEATRGVVVGTYLTKTASLALYCRVSDSWIAKSSLRS